MPDWTYIGDETITTPTLASFIADRNVAWASGETKTLSEGAPTLGHPFQRAHDMPEPSEPTPDPEPTPEPPEIAIP